MIKKSYLLVLIIMMVVTLSACGGLRYSQVAPEAKNFHPARIGALPVDVGTYEEARGSVDQIIAGTLVEKKWFTDVVAGGNLANMLVSNEELRKTVVDYMTKLKTVNFSDPDMSKKIGEIAKVDAFLVVSIDYWDYTVEGGDKIAKVGFGIKMINATNGTILWKAGHHIVKKYMLIKPNLDSLGKTLFKEMIGYMPH